MRKRGRGRPTKEERELPADRYRTQAWARILKKIVAPDMKQSKAEQCKFTGALYKWSDEKIYISDTQFKKWWDGEQCPLEKSIKYFDPVPELQKLTEWLSSKPDGNPLQRHFCSIDALFYSLSTDPVKREKSAVIIDEVMDEIHRRWAPRAVGGIYSYLTRATNDSYGIKELDVGAALSNDENSTQDAQAARLSTQQTKIYDPFSRNSVLIYMLAVGSFNLLPDVKSFRHWVIDFVSGIFVMDAYRLLNNIDLDIFQASSIGHLLECREKFLYEEPSFDFLAHNLKRHPFPFDIRASELTDLLTKSHKVYSEMLNFLGVERFGMSKKFTNDLIPYMSNYFGLGGSIGAQMGQQ